jgi:hypothetical protein
MSEKPLVNQAQVETTDTTVKSSTNENIVKCSCCNTELLLNSKVHIICKCQKAQYCNTLCQKSDWASHKDKHLSRIKDVLVKGTTGKDETKTESTDLDATSIEIQLKDDGDLIKSVDAIFDKFDTDHSGLIEKDELIFALNAAGVEFDEDQVDLLMNAIDTNGDGLIDKNEFRMFVGMNKAMTFNNTVKKMEEKVSFIQRAAWITSLTNPIILAQESVDSVKKGKVERKKCGKGHAKINASTTVSKKDHVYSCCENFCLLVLFFICLCFVASWIYGTIVGISAFLHGAILEPDNLCSDGLLWVTSYSIANLFVLIVTGAQLALSIEFPTVIKYFMNFVSALIFIEIFFGFGIFFNPAGFGLGGCPAKYWMYGFVVEIVNAIFFTGFFVVFFVTICCRRVVDRFVNKKDRQKNNANKKSLVNEKANAIKDANLYSITLTGNKRLIVPGSNPLRNLPSNQNLFVRYQVDDKPTTPKRFQNQICYVKVTNKNHPTYYVYEKPKKAYPFCKKTDGSPYKTSSQGAPMAKTATLVATMDGTQIKWIKKGKGNEV